MKSHVLIAILLLMVSLVPAAVGASNPFAEHDPVSPPAYRELAGLRSENSRTVANPDGTLTTTFSQGPMHYRDSDGTWSVIDTTIPQDGKLKKTKYKVENKSSVDPLRVDYAGGYIAFTPQRAKKVDAVISGSTATYTGLWKDADLVRTYTATGVKEDIVLHTSKAPGEYTWNVATAYEVAQIGNSLQLSVDGVVVGEITAPYATHAGADDIGWVWLVWDAKKSEVRYVLDAQWRATATYPIIIDPTTVFYPAASGDDARVYGSNATWPISTGAGVANTGSVEVRKLWNGSVYTVDTTYLRWDTSALPDTASPVSAFVRFYVTSRANPNNRALLGQWIDDTAYWPLDTGDWVESTGSTAFSVAAGTWVAWTTSAYNSVTLSNVTSANIDTTGYTAFRMSVAGAAPTGTNQVTFNSFDDGTNMPELSITYIAPCTVTTSAATGLSMTSAGVVTGTFNGNLTDDGDSDSLTGSFEFGMTDSYGSESATIALTDAGAYTRPLSSGSLTPGGTLHYRSKVVNEAGTCNGADTTSALTMPTVTTSAATSVEFNFDGTTAVLNGNMTALGIATGAFVLFEYGTTPSYGTETTPVNQTGTGTFSATITGWDGEATMHYRAIARINGVDSVGSDVTFTVNSPGWFLLAKLAPLMGMVLVVFSTIGFFGGSALSYRNGNASAAAWLLMGGVVMISLGLPLVVAIITNSTGFFNP